MKSERTRIILASGSNGRRTIFESLKIPFEVVESQIDEEKIVHGREVFCELFHNER